MLLEAGLDAMRESGKIPRGPPDLPTGAGNTGVSQDNRDVLIIDRIPIILL